MIYTSRLWDQVILDQVAVTLAPSPKNARMVAKSKLRPRAQPTQYPPIGPVIRHLGQAGW